VKELRGGKNAMVYRSEVTLFRNFTGGANCMRERKQLQGGRCELAWGLVDKKRGVRGL